MSTWSPVLQIECTKCSFKYHPQTVPLVNRVYVFEEQFIPIPWKREWCQNCATFKPVENILEKEESLDDYIKLLDMLSTRKDHYEALILQMKSGYFSKMKKIKISDEDAFQLSKIVYDFRSIEGDVRRLFEAKALQKIYMARKNGPKCLECGSEELLSLEIPKSDDAHLRMGPHHPGCDGTLFYAAGGSQLFDPGKQYPYMIFDTDGNFLRQKN